jgi:SAM-dependent methyltransferase
VQIERSGLDGQPLPFADASFDMALSTWTLCTIADPIAALTEIRQVLRPGGALHFIEHGLAPDQSVQRWQHRLEPINKRMFGGCHLSRAAHVAPVRSAAKTGYYRSVHVSSAGRCGTAPMRVVEPERGSASGKSLGRAVATGGKGIAVHCAARRHAKPG